MDGLVNRVKEKREAEAEGVGQVRSEKVSTQDSGPRSGQVKGRKRKQWNPDRAKAQTRHTPLTKSLEAAHLKPR